MATLRSVDPEIDRRVVDLRDEAAAPELRDIAAELAACLRRFVEVSADEHTLERAGEALALWDRLSAPEPPDVCPLWPAEARSAAARRQCPRPAS